jgi:hypothetical protein
MGIDVQSQDFRGRKLVFVIYIITVCSGLE